MLLEESGTSEKAVSQQSESPQTTKAIALVEAKDQHEDIPTTNLGRLLATLESPHETDPNLIVDFEEKVDDLIDQSRSPGMKPISRDEILAQRPDIRAAYERRHNPELQRDLPVVVDVLKKVITQRPDLDSYLFSVRKETPDFYQARAQDLLRILDLNLEGTRVADGRFGQYGERLMYALVKSLGESSAVTSVLEKMEDQHRAGSDSTQTSVAMNEAFVAEADNLLHSVASKLGEKMNNANTLSQNLTDYAEQVHPEYYLVRRAASNLGIVPKTIP